MRALAPRPAGWARSTAPGSTSRTMRRCCTLWPPPARRRAAGPRSDSAPRRTIRTAAPRRRPISVSP